MDSREGRETPRASLADDLPAWARWLVPCAIALAVYASFSPALSAGFLDWDDNFLITDNPELRRITSRFTVFAFTTTLMGHYQPLTWLSFGVDRELFGLEPPEFAGAWGFHLTNLVLHASTAIAFYFLALRLLAIGLDKGRGARAVIAGATFAALFFAVHPLRVESVAWVTERRDVLSGLFFVCAIQAYVGHARGRPAPRLSAAGVAIPTALAAAAALLTLGSLEPAGQALAWGVLGALGLALAVAALIGSALAASTAPRLRYGLAVGLLCLSLLSKAWGIVAPAVLLVLDVWPLGRARGAGKRAVALVVEKAPFLALACCFAVLAQWAQSSNTYVQPSLEDHTPLERLAQAAYGLCFYPYKTLLPLELAPLYEMPLDLPLASLRFGVPLAIVAAVTAIAIWKRRSHPALLAAWVAFAAIVSPVLGVLQSGPQLVADRYSYLSCMPFALLLGAAAVRGVGRGRGLAAGTIALALCWCVVLGVASARQSALWKDNETLWTYARELDPQSVEAAKQLAHARIQEAQRTGDAARRKELLLEAGDMLAFAGKLRPDPRMLGNFALVHGGLVELEPERKAEHLEAALRLSQQSIALASKQGFQLADYQLNYGGFLVDAGRFEEAAEVFQEVTEQRPEFGPAWGNLGIALARSNRWAESRDALQRAVALAPRMVNAWANLAIASLELGEREAAAEAARRTLELAPDNAAAREVLRRTEP